MFLTVRGYSDWLRLACIPILAGVVSIGVRPAQSQEIYQGPQQTNERIRELASLAQPSAAGVPVGPGDLLHVDVFDVPELSRDIRVGDSGDISFPLIHERISASGLTTFQLEEKLEEILASEGLVAHPQVSVLLKEQNSQPVSVVGAVMHPLVLQVMRPTTLLEVLASAGGVSDEAGSTVVITRTPHTTDPHLQQVSDSTAPDQSAATSITIRLQDLLESGKSEFNVAVMGGDVVTVPRAGIVYVLGAGVAQQGEYVMQGHGDQVTVLKAIAMAHGLNSFAKADSAMIMRNNPVTGKRDQIPVQVKRMQNHKAEDVPLQSNDILYVPDSRGKRAMARGTEAALGIGTQVAIYRMP